MTWWHTYFLDSVVFFRAGKHCAPERTKGCIGTLKKGGCTKKAWKKDVPFLKAADCCCRHSFLRGNTWKTLTWHRTLHFLTYIKNAHYDCTSSLLIIIFRICQWWPIFTITAIFKNLIIDVVVIIDIWSFHLNNQAPFKLFFFSALALL